MQKLTAADILSAAKGMGRQINRGQHATDQDAVQAALDLVNQDDILNQEDTALAYVVWDKQSPINGVAADYFLTQRHDVDPSTEIYLLKDTATGHIVMFQPHVAGVSGHVRMDAQSVHTYAENHRQEIVQNRAHGRIIQAALEHL